MVFFEIFYSDPGHDAAGFGYVGVQESDLPRRVIPFSSPGPGIVEANSIAYPLDQGCGRQRGVHQQRQGLDLRHGRRPQQAGHHPPGLHHLIARERARADPQG